jgi:hypothetical protein
LGGARTRNLQESLVKLITNCVLIVAIGLSFSTPAAAELPRRAALGVAFGPPTPGETPIPLVRAVAPGLSAAVLGVKPGDRILQAGDNSVTAASDVNAYALSLRAGNPVKLVVERAGQRLTLTGAAIGRPREAYRGATVRYGAVGFRGGQLADIMVTPNGVKDPPVVYLIQGFTCTTIDITDPSHPYPHLIQALLDAKIAVYRVEKPGVGDSLGGVDCTKIGYASELDGFRTAYRHLTGELGVAPDRVFMLGHSLGGLEAPMLAAERAPRGVAVYGTILRKWSDYYHDIDVFQSYLQTGADLVSEQVRSEADREILQRFFFDHQSPAEIVKARPALAQNLRDLMEWDGGDNMVGRHYRYMQDLNGLPLVQAWKDARTNVLSLYGGSDIVALTGTDEKMIADLVNFYRPGSGTYVEVPNTGHGMDLIGSIPEARKLAMSGQPVPRAPFNPKVAEALIDWIRACLTKPPVAVQAASASASGSSATTADKAA